VAWVKSFDRRAGRAQNPGGLRQDIRVFSLGFLNPIRCAAVVLAVLAAWSPAASAEAARPGRPERETAQHAELGRRYVEMGRDHDAISEYRKAYELRADPTFLFEIAGCYRRLGNAERALFFYERYLAAAPTDDPSISKAEQAITELDPARTRPPPVGGPPALVPSFEHDLIVVPLPPAAPPPEARRPLWRRWWFWTAVGAAAALATTFALTRNGDDQKGVPPSALGNMRFR
jgi:tetratricopeptide (TPR) repeat protein